MKQKIGVAITVALLSTAASVAICEGASAQFNWTQVPAYIDVHGKIGEIERLISESEAAGRLTPDKAQQFKQKLDSLKSSDTSYRSDGKLSIWERMRLVVELDKLTQTIHSSLTERKVASTDVRGREQEIEKQIAESVMAGRLTNSEAAIFNQRLSTIRQKEAALRQSGSVNPNEQLNISLELDKLLYDMEQRLKPRVVEDPELSSKQSQIRSRIAELKASGKITALEAEGFSSELQRILSREQAFKASGGILDSEETLTLALEMERLNGKINGSAPPVESAFVQSVDQLQDEARKAINNAQAGGKLNVQESNELTGEFDRIEALESMFRRDGTLSTSEVNTLKQDLSKLKTRVDSLTKRTSVAGVEKTREALATRIADAASAGRFKPPTIAQDLQAELARIQSKEKFYKSDGALNDTETLILSRDLDSLNSRFESLLSALPDVSERKEAIEKQINQALASGRLETKKASDIKQELNRITYLEDTFRGSDGVLEDREVVALAREYDKLEKTLDAALPPLPDVVALRKDLAAQVAGNASNGSLSSSDAASLSDELARIEKVIQSFQRTDEGLADWEVLAVKRDLDKVSDDLNRLTKKESKPSETASTQVDTSQVSADTRGHWAEKYIAILQDRGIIGGFPDGSFKPDQGITRAQFAAIAVKALDLPEAGRGATFNDVPQKHWAYKAVSAVSEKGLVTGFPDGSYRPADRITRTQALVILAKALAAAQPDKAALDRYKDADKIPAWATPSVSKAAGAGIIVNHPDPYRIRPSDDATRAEVAALTYQTMAELGKSLPRITVGLEASEN